MTEEKLHYAQVTGVLIATARRRGAHLVSRVAPAIQPQDISRFGELIAAVQIVLFGKSC
jgi:hypothetical protein